jgi:protein CpxP
MKPIGAAGSCAEEPRRMSMNRIRSFAVGTMLMLALTVVARPVTTTPRSSAEEGQSNGVPAVEPMMKLFTEKLDLSSDQQTQLKPILVELHDATLKSVQDEGMSSAERLDHVRAARYAADKKIRVLLNEEQAKKLDQMEREPHPELHGNIYGAAQQK